MNLMDLFDVEDYEKGKKGKKSGTGKGAKGGKKETAAKGVRYPLPVRVSAGHIRCLLDAGEFSGKTVSETDVKKKIREVYPELAGVEFSLVKFSNSYTEQYENNNSIIPNEIEGEIAKESLKRKNRWRHRLILPPRRMKRKKACLKRWKKTQKQQRNLLRMVKMQT